MVSGLEPLLKELILGGDTFQATLYAILEKADRSLARSEFYLVPDAGIGDDLGAVERWTEHRSLRSLPAEATAHTGAQNICDWIFAHRIWIWCDC